MNVSMSTCSRARQKRVSIIDVWRYDPNWFPPHSSLGLLMPKEFADQQGNGPPEQVGVSANRPLAPSPHQWQTLTDSTHECGEVGEEASPPALQQTAAICMTSGAAYQMDGHCRISQSFTRRAILSASAGDRRSRTFLKPLRTMCCSDRSR